MKSVLSWRRMSIHQFVTFSSSIQCSRTVIWTNPPLNGSKKKKKESFRVAESKSWLKSNQNATASQQEQVFHVVVWALPLVVLLYLVMTSVLPFICFQSVSWLPSVSASLLYPLCRDVKPIPHPALSDSFLDLILFVSASDSVNQISEYWFWIFSERNDLFMYDPAYQQYHEWKRVGVGKITTHNQTTFITTPGREEWVPSWCNYAVLAASPSTRVSGSVFVSCQNLQRR